MFKLFSKTKTVTKPVPQMLKQPNAQISIKIDTHLGCTDEFPAHLLRKTEASFERIYQNLYLHWGNPEFHAYLRKLLLNNDRDRREGFQYDIMLEIQSLGPWHDVAFPQYRTKTDPWDFEMNSKYDRTKK